MNEKYNVLVTYDIEQYHTQVRKKVNREFWVRRSYDW